MSENQKDLEMKEDDSLIKKGENAYYGYFVRYIWRNEKNGNSYFQICTKQNMLFSQQYQKKEKKKNRSSNVDEDWYTIVCDGSDYPVPYFEKHMPIKVTGYFLTTNKDRIGWNFKVTSVATAAKDETVTIQYLASGIFEGIDYEAAVQIVHCQPDILTYIEKEGAVQELTEKTGLPYPIIRNMADAILSAEEERKIFTTFAKYGISYSACAKAVKLYGKHAMEQMLKDPYRIGYKIGLQFQQCDAIAYHCKIEGTDSRRIKALGFMALSRLNSNGNTWAYSKEFYRAMDLYGCNQYYTDRLSPSIAVSSLKNVAGYAFQEGQGVFYQQKIYEAEIRIAKNIRRIASISSEKEPFYKALIPYAEKACNIIYGKQQSQAFQAILSTKGIKAVNGGPGTGKTTTIKGILYAYERMHPDAVIKLCAPSGRAAQRMSESTERPATTVHRLLEYRPFGDRDIHKDASDPIEADVIVVDEMSMMSVELFDIFLEAVKTGTTLILVGDIDQLEAVGPGAVFRDLLNAPDKLIQKVLLTEIFRQKEGSPIILNSKKINRGDPNLLLSDDFHVLRTKNEEETLRQVNFLMQKLYNPQDPFETQILCPANRGESGIYNINVVLQNLLNHSAKGIRYGSTAFRINDKIIMFRNNYSADYYNGDIGVIKSINENNQIFVEIRGNEFELKKDMLDDMHLSYGMTIHKSQGSEFKNVIIVLPMEPKGMLVRNLLYTAVTRAKTKVYIISEGSALETAVKITRAEKRKTLLSKYLSDESE